MFGLERAAGEEVSSLRSRGPPSGAREVISGLVSRGEGSQLWVCSHSTVQGGAAHTWLGEDTALVAPT